MTHDEFAFWKAKMGNSRFKWTEDEIVRLNGRGLFYYLGGEDGIYMKIGKDGTLTAGTYEGAIPHIGEAMFKEEVRVQCADFNAAFERALNAGGKKFLVDMFSGSPPVIPQKNPRPPGRHKGRGSGSR